MILDPSRIPEEGVALEGEVDPAALELRPEDLAEAQGPIRCEFWAWKQGEEVFVRGAVRVPVRFQCARCGAFFSTTVEDSAFLCSYLTHEGQTGLDVSGEVREAILLALPRHPWCGPDCRGVCPRCGRNLNEGPCACPPEEASTPWGALDSLPPPGGGGDRSGG